MRYDSELLKVEGRVLPTERVSQNQTLVCTARFSPSFHSARQSSITVTLPAWLELLHVWICIAEQYVCLRIFVARVQGGAGGLDAGDGQNPYAQPDGVRRLDHNDHKPVLAARARSGQTPRSQLPHFGHELRSS